LQGEKRRQRELALPERDPMVYFSSPMRSQGKNRRDQRREPVSILHNSNRNLEEPTT